MTSILSKWLNQNVHLSKVVTPNTLETDFRSGYFIAEILDRFDLLGEWTLDSFQALTPPLKPLNLPPSLIHKTSKFILEPEPLVIFEEVAVSNFIRLEPLLRNQLGLRLSANEAFALIQGKRDMCTQFLLRLKVALEDWVHTLRVHETMEETMKTNVGFFGSVKDTTAGADVTSSFKEGVELMTMPAFHSGLNQLNDRPSQSGGGRRGKRGGGAAVATTYVFPNRVKEAKGVQDHHYFETQLRAKLRRYNTHPQHDMGLSEICKGAPVGELLDKMIARRDVLRLDSRGKLLSSRKTLQDALHPVGKKGTWKDPENEDLRDDQEEENEGVEEGWNLSQGVFPKTFNTNKLTTNAHPSSRQERQQILLNKKREERLDLTIKELQRNIQRVERSIHHKEGALGKDFIEDDEAESPEKDTLEDKGLSPYKIKHFVKMKAHVPKDVHLESLKEMLPGDNIQQQEKKEYMNEIRIRRLQEEQSRKDREKRRRKLILAELSFMKNMDEEQKEVIQIGKLMKQSKQERRIAEQLAEIRREKELMIENRKFREAQYLLRRQQDYEEALQREYLNCEQARRDYLFQTDIKLKQHQEILEQKSSLKREKHYRFCKDIFWQMVEMAFKISEYKTLNSGTIPDKFLREWKVLFLENRSLEKESYLPFHQDSCAIFYPLQDVEDVDEEVGNITKSLHPMPANGVATHSTTTSGGRQLLALEHDQLNALKSISLLDERELYDYLDGKGEWRYSDSSGPPLKNELLGRIVQNIIDLTRPLPKKHQGPVLPPVNLNMAIIGKPFSGKKTLALNIAQAFKLHVLVFDDLVSDAVKEARQEFDEPHGKEKGKKSSLRVASVIAQIGAKIQMALLEGATADDALLVSLVVESIRKATQQDTSMGGWILVDFPQTRNQAQLLERELSGYEEKKPVKPGNLKRFSKDKPDKNEKSADPRKVKKSLVAPVSEPKIQDNATASSSIDKVFLLDIPHNIALKRAMGRRIDPVTGKTYHLEFDPPPVDQPGVIERLIPVVSDVERGHQLQFQLTSFDDQIELFKDWYSRFQNIHCLDGEQKKDDITQATLSILETYIQQKKERKDTLEDPKTTMPPNNIVSALQTRVEPATTPPPVIQNAPSQQLLHTVNAHGNEEMYHSNQDNRSLGGSVSHPAEGTFASNLVEDTSQSTTKAHGDSDSKRKTSGRPRSGGKKGLNQSLNEKLAHAGSTVPLPAGGPAEKGGTEKTKRHALSPAPLHLSGPALTDDLAQPCESDPAQSWTNYRTVPRTDLAMILHNQWVDVENSFTDVMKYAFRCLRRERESIIRYFYNTKVNFKTFLERPDLKQRWVEGFQKDYNEMEDDLRCDPEAKSELHQRAEDLRETLWQMSDKRRDEAELERQLIIEDKCVEDHIAILSSIYVAMIQGEVNLYHGNKQVIMDYYRDLQCLPLDELPPNNQGLSHLLSNVYDTNSNQQGGAGSSENLVRSVALQQRRENSASLVNQEPAPTKNVPPAGKKPTKSQPQGAQPTQAAPIESGENDMTLYADILTAYEMAMNAMTIPAEVVIPQEKEKKDKKKGAAAEPNPETKVSEPEIEYPPECISALQTEDAVFKLRLERLRNQACEHLKELRNRGLDLYSTLEKWITFRYQNEMNAIRDMLLLIKEAIELEIRLPNQLVLEGENFKMDFEILTFEPEPEPRPESPVEEPAAEHFTVIQMLNLSMQFRDLAPSGIISNKEFVESLQRLAALSIGDEQLPDDLMSAEPHVWTQLCLTLDPFESGFVSWRKFIILHSRILPVSSPDAILALKSAYHQCPSFNNGKISMEDYLSVPLWFEEMKEEELDEILKPPGKFNRAAKLKKALYYFFSVKNGYDVSEKKSQELTLPGDDEVSGTSKEEISVSIVPTTVADTILVGGQRFPLFHDHDPLPVENSLFDVTSFLLYACLDPIGKTGLLKAFLVMSRNNDGKVDLNQLYELLHFSTVIVPESHRISENGGNEDIFPKEALQTLIQQSDEHYLSLISFESFARLIENTNIANPMLLYQIEDLTISSKAPKKEAKTDSESAK